MRRTTVVGMLLLSCCHGQDSFDLPKPKPPGLPIFAGNWSNGGRLLHMERPRYPPALRYLGVQTIRLKGTILEDGSVTEIVLVDGPERLLPVARAAVARWRYEPLRLYSPYTGKSTPVTVKTTVDLRFDP